MTANNTLQIKKYEMACDSKDRKIEGLERTVQELQHAIQDLCE